MGIIFGILSIIGFIIRWPWLVIVGGSLTVLSDLYGAISGKLRGCLTTIIFYVIGIGIFGLVLPIWGFGIFPAIIGSIAFTGMLLDIFGLIFQKRIINSM